MYDIGYNNVAVNKQRLQAISMDETPTVKVTVVPAVDSPKTDTIIVPSSPQILIPVIKEIPVVNNNEDFDTYNPIQWYKSLNENQKEKVQVGFLWGSILFIVFIFIFLS